MFENLTDKLTAVFDNLRRRGKLSEEDVEKAMREVRLTEESFRPGRVSLLRAFHRILKDQPYRPDQPPR